MPVVAIELDVAGFHGFHCGGISFAPVDPRHDLGTIAAVVAACASETPGDGLSMRPEGLAAELTGRPGRDVWAWIARAVAAESRPVGLVTLIRAGRPGCSRWSIGWLVVHAAFRRQGIGRALVAGAVHFAGTQGARVVHAETLDRWVDAAAFWRIVRLAPGRDAATLPASGESRKTAEG